MNTWEAAHLRPGGQVWYMGGRADVQNMNPGTVVCYDYFQKLVKVEFCNVVPSILWVEPRILSPSIMGELKRK